MLTNTEDVTFEVSPDGIDMEEVSVGCVSFMPFADSQFFKSFRLFVELLLDLFKLEVGVV